MKQKKVIFRLVFVCILAFLILMGYFLWQYISVMMVDKSWIRDFGFQEGEVYHLSLDAQGCPLIPVKIANNKIPFIFDSGCSSGFLVTTLLENKIDYTVLGQTEQLNRDGSHRGWSKTVRINEFSVFGENHVDVETTLADWKMISSNKFNGLIGLKYFLSQVITLDYTGRKIAVTNHSVDYNKLDKKKYLVLPLLKSNQDDQRNLLFFEAEFNGEPITVYLDTGKNYSYLNNSDSTNSMGTGKPITKRDISIVLNNMKLPLKGVLEANLAQVADLPHPVTVELNSDQIKKNNLLITIDLITQHIIFRKM